MNVLPNLDAQCLAVDPLNRQSLYAGGASGGLYASRDGGLSWSPSPVQPPKMHISDVAVSRLERHDEGGTIYVGTEPSSVYKSNDAGCHWTDLISFRDIPSAPTWSFPPRPWTSHIRWITLSPHDPALILVVVELGGIMRSDDGGNTWLDRPADAYLDCHALSMPVDKPGVVYECANGGFAISADSGLTWIPQDEGIDRRYLFSMAVDHHNTDLVYVGGSTDPHHAHYAQGDARAAIYRRKPDGTWETLGDMASPPLPHFPYGLATDPDEIGMLYVGFGNGDIMISSDRGEHFERPEIEGDKPERIEAMLVL